MSGREDHERAIRTVAFLASKNIELELEKENEELKEGMERLEADCEYRDGLLNQKDGIIADLKKRQSFEI